MEKVIHAVSAVSGAVIGFMFGEVTGLLVALVFFMVIDYATGVVVAYYKHQLSSEVGFKGIAKKIIILCLISIGHMIDVYVIGSNAVVMSATAMFYIGNEGLSILENAADLGIPLPPPLIKALKQISDAQKKKDEEAKKDKESEKGKESEKENESEENDKDKEDENNGKND